MPLPTLYGTKHTVAAASTVTTLRNVRYDDTQTLDLYCPSNPAVGQPVVIFYHGGLWQNGDKKDYNFIGQTLATHGILTLIVNYRLYPAAGFPGFLQDGVDAVVWARQNVGQYGGNPDRIFLMGHSAGAYIAAMLALDPEYLRSAGLGPGNIAGVIGVAGLYNFVPSGDPGYAPVFAGAVPETTQPINYTSGHAPPMLLISADRDDKVDPANTTALAARIQSQGGKAQASLYPETGHIGILLPFSPLYHGSTAIVDEVITFITAPRVAG